MWAEPHGRTAVSSAGPWAVPRRQSRATSAVQPRASRVRRRGPRSPLYLPYISPISPGECGARDQRWWGGGASKTARSTGCATLTSTARGGSSASSAAPTSAAVSAVLRTGRYREIGEI